MNDFLQLAASRQSDRAYDMSRAELEAGSAEMPSVAFWVITIGTFWKVGKPWRR